MKRLLLGFSLVVTERCSGYLELRKSKTRCHEFEKLLDVVFAVRALFDICTPQMLVKLIGIEYTIRPDLFETFDKKKRQLWHSHAFEVKSEIFAMPGPTAPGLQQAWEAAETKKVEKVVDL